MGTSAERRTMRENVRALPNQARYLIVGTFINRFASFAVIFLILYLRRLGYSLTQAGLVMAVYGVGELFASALGGGLADRLGRRTTIVASMLGSAVVMVLLSLAGPYWQFVSLAVIAGVVTEMYRPAGNALLADLVPEGERVTSFALLRVATNLAHATGSAAAGFLATHSFHWLFWSDAATSVAFAVIALTVLPEGRRTTVDQRAERGAYRAALKDRRFSLFLLAAVLIAFIYLQQQAILPLYIVGIGLTYQDFGILLSLNGVLIVLLELPISSVTMRLPARPTISAGFLLIGVGFGLTAFAHSLATLALTVVVWTAGEMVSAPVAFAYVADIAPEHMRGRYQGLYALAWSSGTITGPAIGSVVFAANSVGFWMLCLALGVVAAWLLLLGRPARVIPAPEAASPARDVPFAVLPDPPVPPNSG